MIITVENIHIPKQGNHIGFPIPEIDVDFTDCYFKVHYFRVEDDENEYKLLVPWSLHQNKLQFIKPVIIDDIINIELDVNDIQSLRNTCDNCMINFEIIKL